ncbi:MAG: VCBS repeat-containing protein, partial [Candidatus Hydrogenedentes bacterium]|nr:VCBS repeat-containing protein [Candidatus Hydrogenedentota bacterium]
VVDWDNDGREGLLTASFEGVFLHAGPTRDGNSEELQIALGDRGPRPKQGASEVALGALRTTGGRFIATIEPWHGHQVVVYTPPTPERLPWERMVIDDTFNDGHALDVADLDGDGDGEIIAGHRGAPYGLFIYRRAATPSGWQRFSLDLGGVAAAGIFVADLNQDGRPDIAATGAATNNVVWYENRSASPA